MYDPCASNTSNSIDLNVHYCGIEKCKPKHSYGPGIRNHFVIHYVLNGCGRVVIDNCEYTLKKNEGFLIPPDKTVYYEADEQNPWEYTWIGFNGIKADQYLKEAGLDYMNPIFVYDKDEFLSQRFSQIVGVYQSKGENMMRLQGLLYMLLAELAESNNRQITKNESIINSYVEEAVKYIQANYRNHISVNELAERLGLNRSYFSAMFRQYIGMPPQEFLVRFRIDISCNLISRTDLSISDIANAVGYDDPLNFSKMFKKIKGVSPYNYRKGLNVNA